MTQIDWNEAPEWADGHGEVHCLTTRKIWFNEHVYMYIGDSRSYQWCGKDADLVHNHGRKSVTNVTLRPAAWTGSGLPPVGTMVELVDKGYGLREGATPFLQGQWAVAASFVMSSGTEMAVLDGGSEYGCEVFRVEMLIPARTPAQLAAEEREKAIEDMCNTSFDKVTPRSAGLLYDAGYRKVEVKP